MSDPMDILERKMNQEAVKYAVQRAIFCPDCGDILDMTRAVLVTGNGGAGVACGECWDKAMAERSVVDHAAFAAAVADGRVTLDDGRELFRP